MTAWTCSELGVTELLLKDERAIHTGELERGVECEILHGHLLLKA